MYWLEERELPDPASGWRIVPYLLSLSLRKPQQRQQVLGSMLLPTGRDRPPPRG